MRICSIFLIDKKINGAFCQQLDCGREDYILKMKLSVRTITHDLARSTCFDLLIETKVPPYTCHHLSVAAHYCVVGFTVRDSGKKCKNKNHVRHVRRNMAVSYNDCNAYMRYVLVAGACIGQEMVRAAKAGLIRLRFTLHTNHCIILKLETY